MVQALRNRIHRRIKRNMETMTVIRLPCRHDFTLQPVHRGMAIMSCGRCRGMILLLPRKRPADDFWVRFIPDPIQISGNSSGRISPMGLISSASPRGVPRDHHRRMLSRADRERLLKRLAELRDAGPRDAAARIAGRAG